MKRLMLFTFVLLVVCSTASWSEPVDTRVFGLLSLGTSDQDILKTLGQPDQIIPQPTRFIRSGRDFVETKTTVWVYAGGCCNIPTRLTFQNGTLVSKDKKR